MQWEVGVLGGSRSCPIPTGGEGQGDAWKNTETDRTQGVVGPPHHSHSITPWASPMLWAGEGRGCHIRPHQRLQASCLLQSGCAALQRDSAHSLASHPPPPALRPTSGGHTHPHFGGTLPIACFTPRAAPCPTYPPPKSCTAPLAAALSLLQALGERIFYIYLLFFSIGEDGKIGDF